MAGQQNGASAEKNLDHHRTSTAKGTSSERRTVTYDTTDYAGETTRDAKDTVKDAAVHAAETAKSIGGRFTDAVEDLITGDSDGDGH